MVLVKTTDAVRNKSPPFLIRKSVLVVRRKNVKTITTKADFRYSLGRKRPVEFI